MKNKIKINYIIYVLIFIVLCCIIIFLFLSKSKNNNFYNISKKKSMVLKICKNSNCKMPSTLRYDVIDINSNIRAVNEKVDFINNETKKLYNKAINSDMNVGECSKAIDTYNYRYAHSTFYDLYEDDKYMSISAQRTETDVCLGTVSRQQREVYIYDKKRRNFISQDDFIISLGISKKEIVDRVREVVTSYGKSVSKNYTIDDSYKDYVLYYGSDKKVSISMKLPGENMYLFDSLW